MTLQESKINIEGPYDPINPDDETSSAEKRDIGEPGVNLYNCQEARADNKAQVNASFVPGEDSDEAILGGFLGREEFQFKGTATGNRMAGGDTGVGFSGRNRLPADPFAAVKSYALRLESLILYNQGWGYKLTDEQRSRTIDPSGTDRGGFVVEKVTWERSSGQKYGLEYTVEGSRAKGTSVGEPSESKRADYISRQKDNWLTGSDGISGSIPFYIPFGEEKEDPNQVYGWTLVDPDVPNSAFTLGSVDKMRVERSVDTNIKEIALGDPGDNIAIPTSSPKLSLFIEGSLTPKDTIHRTSVSNYSQARDRLNDFARFIPNNWVGTNKDIVVREGFTDRQIKGQFKNYSTTWESGQDLQLNYTIELIQGEGIGNS